MTDVELMKLPNSSDFSGVLLTKSEVDNLLGLKGKMALVDDRVIQFRSVYGAKCRHKKIVIFGKNEWVLRYRVSSVSILRFNSDNLSIEEGYYNEEALRYIIEGFDKWIKKYDKFKKVEGLIKDFNKNKK